MDFSFNKILRPLTLCTLLIATQSFALGESSYISTKANANNFLLASPEVRASIYVDANDYPGVQRASLNLQTDVQKVSQQTLPLSHEKNLATRSAILIGTLGHSELIDELVRTKKINVSQIVDQWDAYQLQVIKNPTPNIQQALVIVGSNKRGTSYGIYDLSEQIGVSPWYWWADVPIKTKNKIYVDSQLKKIDMPKIKYRGIFLNDEAPALTGWVQAKYGNYNHEFYEKVFELLLRLKANYLWPAMWNNAFNVDDPLNMQLADDYGIVMGTSHHEPMMRAHKEWGTSESAAVTLGAKSTEKKNNSGKWDYHTNQVELYHFWEGGIERNKNFENLITIGMRGDGDEPMSESENISLLEKIVADQREIISRLFKQPAEKIPQVWALYKEVQGYYDKGMRVPDDVTLLWCDDNWGNIRRLPTPDERKRSGGAGVYYHFDYVGGPRSYRWINTISIAKIWEQMNLAYQMNARTIWIVNVGDLKPMEYPIEFFMRMAWNPEAWPKERIPDYSKLFAAREFGDAYANDIADLLVGYTRHNLHRKPELQDENTYSQLNYQEADRVSNDIAELRKKAETLATKLSPEYKDAFFELVLHPVTASSIITQMYDAVAKNHMYANQGRNYANQYATQARELYAADVALRNTWDTQLANGKWQHFMDQPHIGYTYWNNPPANSVPVLYDRVAHAESDMGVAVEGNSSAWPVPGSYVLQTFDPYGKKSRSVEIFNKGTKEFKAKITSSAPWILVNKTEAIISGNQSHSDEGKIDVSIDWTKAPKGLSTGKVKVTGTGWDGANIKITANNPESIPKNTQAFVEADGVVSIEAEHFSVSKTQNNYRWEIIPQHGRHLSSISVFPFTDNSFNDPTQAPWVEYPVYLFSSGDFDIETEFAPSWAFAPAHGLRFAISVDDQTPQVLDVVKDRSDAAWEESVKSDRRVVVSKHHFEKPGLHSVKIFAVDAGVVLERLVVNTGGLLPSYLGPQENLWVGKPPRNHGSAKLGE